MKKEVIYVPKDKCPLDTIKELGDEAISAWVFLHKNVIEKLKEINVYVSTYYGCGDVWMVAAAIEKYEIPRMRIQFDWIACKDPENIFFIQMEEWIVLKKPEKIINFFSGFSY